MTAYCTHRATNNKTPTTSDRCIDYSDPLHPVLWIITPHAWYKVAGAGWWDFVAPHSTYAAVFEPSRRTFAVASLVARCIQSRREVPSGSCTVLLYIRYTYTVFCVVHPSGMLSGK